MAIGCVVHYSNTLTVVLMGGVGAVTALLLPVAFAHGKRVGRRER